MLLVFSFVELTNSQTVQWAVRPTSAQLEGYGNLIKIKTKGKVGLINHENRIIVPAEYDSISPFRDGYALAMSSKNNQLKIDAVISESDFDIQPLSETVYATPYMWFSEGKMPVKGAGGWGYLGTDGNIAIPCQFQAAFPFSEGFASVMLDDRAYYINRNIDYLPVEAGYGNLLFASTFSGEEAVVYSANGYNPKGYVINRRGRIIKHYKVKSTDLKVNKYDHSVGNREQKYKDQVVQLKEDASYEIYKSDQLYGYKKAGKVVLPAQLDKAEPIRGNFANVRFKGQNGILRIVDGNFSIQMKNNRIEVSGNEIKKGCLQLNVPTALEDANILLKMYDEAGEEMSAQANTNFGELREYLFQPANKPLKNSSQKCKVEIWSENLLLWRGSSEVSYNIRKEPIIIDNPTEKVKESKLSIAYLSVSTIKPKSKRASPKNVFSVTVAVKNDGDLRGNATITLLVDGKQTGIKSISVKGHGLSDAIFNVSDIRKERYAKVKAILKEGDGKKSGEANIHFMPFN